MKIKSFLFALLFSQVCASTADAQTWCNRHVRFVDDFVIVNSPWGRGTISTNDYTNCQQKIDDPANPLKTRFRWDWPDTGTREDRVKAFNHISLGINPDTQTYRGTKLPLQLKNLPSPFKINVSTTKIGTQAGKWNYSINMRAYSGTDPDPSNQVAEIHIYEDYSGNYPNTNDDRDIGEFYVDGSSYHMREIRNGKGQPYFQAWRKNKRNGGVINVRAHLL